MTDHPRIPEPLPPAQQRARRSRQRATIRESQQARMLPSPAPAPRPAGVQPAGKRFELEDVQRVPVTVSAQARALIDASTSQGRLLPQALSEHFAEAGNIASVDVDAVLKSQHFAVYSHERDTVLGGPEPWLLVITAHHRSGSSEHDHTWHINASDLADLHPLTKMPLFQAALAAQELWRLYPHKHVPVRDER
jgi:hypothetical protein